MKVLFIAAVAATIFGGSTGAGAQSVVLLDSTGKVAGKPVNDTMMLIEVQRGVVAPASIRAVYDSQGRAASGIATWASGGSVLFASTDCTSGAHVFASSHPGLRATAQLETPAGIVLHVGAIGNARTVSVRSILYSSGCRPVAIEQSGVVPVDATVNLTTTYPPPLSIQ